MKTKIFLVILIALCIYALTSIEPAIRPNYDATRTVSAIEFRTQLTAQSATRTNQIDP